MLSCIDPTPLLNNCTNHFVTRFYPGDCSITMTCQAEIRAAALA